MRGVTLIELIVVIAITGIVGAAVAVFIRRPVEAYADAARRAALTDEADTALRRITHSTYAVASSAGRPRSSSVTTLGNTHSGSPMPSTAVLATRATPAALAA